MYGPEPLLLPAYDLPARPAEQGIGDPASHVLEKSLHGEVLLESRARLEALEIPAALLAGVEDGMGSAFDRPAAPPAGMAPGPPASAGGSRGILNQCVRCRRPPWSRSRSRSR